LDGDAKRRPTPALPGKAHPQPLPGGRGVGMMGGRRYGEEPTPSPSL